MDNNINKVNSSGHAKTIGQIPKSIEFTASKGKFAAGYVINFLSDYTNKWFGKQFAKVSVTLNYGGMETKQEGYLSKDGRLYVDEASSTSGEKVAFAVRNKQTGEKTNYVLEAEVPKKAPVEPKPVIDTNKAQTNYQDSYVSYKPEVKTQPATENTVHEPVGATKPQIYENKPKPEVTEKKPEKQETFGDLGDKVAKKARDTQNDINLAWDIANGK